MGWATSAPKNGGNVKIVLELISLYLKDSWRRSYCTPEQKKPRRLCYFIVIFMAILFD